VVGWREGVERVKEWVTSKQNQPGLCHTMALPFTCKNGKSLRQKKNNENSNISPCKNIIFKKKLLKETKILQDIITL
jgi:hypothetical protein